MYVCRYLGGIKREWEPHDLESVVSHRTWVIWTILRFSGSAASTLKLRSYLSSPIPPIFNVYICMFTYVWTCGGLWLVLKIILSYSSTLFNEWGLNQIQSVQLVLLSRLLWGIFLSLPSGRLELSLCHFPVAFKKLWQSKLGLHISSTKTLTTEPFP